MARKKAIRKRLPKRKFIQPLDKIFDCPFCNHERVCQVKMDRERKVGFISCRVCMEDFQCATHHLSEPVDVYVVLIYLLAKILYFLKSWIDACESANK